MEADKNGTIASTSPTIRTIDRPTDGTAPSFCGREAEEPHSGRLSRGAPEEHEVPAGNQDPAEPEQHANEPLRTKASYERGHERDDGDQQQ